MDALDTMRNDLERFQGRLSSSDWDRVATNMRAVDCQQGQIIFAKDRRQLLWLFVTRGLAAAEQPEHDGTIGISRFFEPGHFCTNVTSISKPEDTGEIVVAITPVTGILITNKFFQTQYRSNGVLGPYLREKMMEAILYDRELLRVKTANDIETRYKFLASRNTDIVHRAPVADIARFVGIPRDMMHRFMEKIDKPS